MSCKYNCVNGRIFLEGLGRWSNCPECGSIKKALERIEDGCDKTLKERLRIPAIYLDSPIMDEELFLHPDIAVKYSSKSIEKVVNLLKTMNKDILSGVVTCISTFFYTSDIIDDYMFIYPYIRTALEKGMSVVPLVSINTLYTLKVAMDFNLNDPIMYTDTDKLKMTSEMVCALNGLEFIKAYKVFYRDFILADVCFLEVTASTSRSAFFVLADLLAERSKLNKPTFVFGYMRSGSFYNKSLDFLLADDDMYYTRLSKLYKYELLTHKAEKSKPGIEVSSLIKYGSVEPEKLGGISVGDLVNKGV